MASRVPWSKIAPAGGAYRIAQRSGLTTVLNAADCLWSCQWTSTALRAVIQKFKVNCIATTAFGTAQTIDVGLYVARAYTIADTGGTGATLTTNNGKLDTNFPTTSMADMRIATAAAITAGTRTLDAMPILIRTGWSGVIGSQIGDPSFEHCFGLYDATNPITLRTNEGLVLNLLTTQGATGVMYFYVEIEWSEVPYNLA